MQLTVSKLSDFKKYWKKTLSILPLEWLYLSAYHNKESDFIEIAGIHNKEVCDYSLYSISSFIWHSCRTLMKQKGIKRARIRLIPAKEEFKSYSSFEAKKQETWSIPFDYRSVEIKSDDSEVPNVVVIISHDKNSGGTYIDGKKRNND